MQRGLIVVKAGYDREAEMWFVESSDLDGLNAEAATLEGLLASLPDLVSDLLEEDTSSDHDGDFDVPIELIAHASTRMRHRAPA